MTPAQETTSTKSNKNINFVRVNVQNSSWRPPGRSKIENISRITNIFIVIFLLSFNPAANAQIIKDAELVPNPAAVHIDSNQASRQGRQRWARSTTTERNLVQSSWTPILSSSTDPDPAQTQPSSSTYFGRKLARDSQILRKSSTVEEPKPSHIRKRNFGATFLDAVDKENAEKITDINDLPTAGNNKPWIGISDPVSDIVSDRARGTANVASRSFNRETDFKEWERLRLLNVKTRSKPESFTNGSTGSTLGPSNSTEPRRRIKLKGSFLGIYSKGLTTPRTRADEDLPQRPEIKRERIRNLRIRRPFISGNDVPRSSSTSTAPTTTTTSTTTTVKSTTISEKKEESLLSASPSLADSEKIINLKGGFKEYKEIVRTSSKPAPSSTSSLAPVTTTSEIFLEDDATTLSSTSTTTSSTTGVTDADEIGDTTTTKNIDSDKVLPKLTENISEPSVSSIQSAETSSAASSTVTESKELSAAGSSVDEIKQSKTQQSSSSSSTVSLVDQAQTSTRNPIEITRPREALQKDLLEAIRRKISRNKAATQLTENEGQNFLSSTKPPLYRPLSFVGSKKSATNGSESKVKIFVNLPNKYQEGAKIPNISHLRNKLERLNEAITEGLKLDKLREEEEVARENDWRHDDHEGDDESVQKSHSSSAQIVVQTDSSESGNQETIRKQFTETSSNTEPTTTTATPDTTATTSTVKTTTTKSSSAVKKMKKPVTEHPSSHYRPSNWTESDFIPMPKSNLPPQEDVHVFVAKPSTVPYTPVIERNNNRSGSATTQSLNRSPSKEPTDGDGQDITNTTIIVISVIAVIPIAGLVAWSVRTVLRRKGLSGSESSSETGLNRPITEDDSLQISGRGGLSYAGHGFDSIAEAPENIPKDQGSCSAAADMLGSVWEFPRSRLRLQTVLGEGNFGKVWKAEADEICGNDGTSLVAVKTVKENSAQKEVDDLIQEMKIMQEIGSHPNVVTILGVCTEQEPYLLVMEYVMYGKLLTHLREHRMKQSSFFNFSKDGGEVGEALTSKDLTKFAYGVAKGMEYLVSKGIIHRDLAARNILVDHTKNTKISDFGLSRSLRDLGSEMYEQKTKGALPIRWMAPESLYFSVFTPKSDVWGFGILLWEIVTLGSTPYPGMGAREVMRKVRDGYRLERPAHCHPDLYHIIQKCWLGDMNKRPDFSDLRKELAKLLEDQHGYIDLQNIPENKYYSMDKNPDEDEKL